MEREPTTATYNKSPLQNEEERDIMKLCIHCVAVPSLFLGHVGKKKHYSALMNMQPLNFPPCDKSVFFKQRHICICSIVDSQKAALGRKNRLQVVSTQNLIVSYSASYFFHLVRGYCSSRYI